VVEGVAAAPVSTYGDIRARRAGNQLPIRSPAYAVMALTLVPSHMETLHLASVLTHSAISLRDHHQICRETGVRHYGRRGQPISSSSRVATKQPASGPFDRERAGLSRRSATVMWASGPTMRYSRCPH